MVLTAAHCISEGLTPGSVLSGVGKIVKTTIHPKYAAAKQAKATAPRDAKAKAMATLYDLAFIEVEARASQRAMEYPQIISAQTKLGTRKKMEMAGYGMNEVSWNGEKFDYRSTKNSLQIANNEWDECPLDYFGNEVKALSEFNSNLKDHMKIKATRQHLISDGAESITYNNQGMILPGDSGSPSIERDENNKFVVTGVASNIVNYADGSGEASFEIEVAGVVVANKELAEFPDNWGLKTKSDKEFSEIKSVLEQKGLLDDNGEPKAGVVIKRKYKRVAEGNYSDLSHPENQRFIKSVMSK